MRLGETDYLGCMLINPLSNFSGWTRVGHSTLFSVTNRGNGESNSSALFSRSLSEKQCSKRYASLVECKDANYSTTKSRLL